MSRTTLACFALVSALACTESAPKSEKNHPKPSADDTSATADDTGGVEEEVWGPAEVRPGAYTMTISEVPADTCGGRIVAGATEDVAAPSNGTYVQLWGYLPLEASNRKNMRGSGSIDRTNPEGTCTITEATTVTGRLVSGIKFGLDLERTLTPSGTGCVAPSPTEPCAVSWSAVFEFIEPAGTDTGAPPPSP